MGDDEYWGDIEVPEDSSSDWSDLHEDYLQQFLNKFTSVSDCLRFGSVCVSWRNILVPHIHPDLLHPQLPLLLIPTPTPPIAVEKQKEQTRSLYSVSEKKVYKDIEIKLPYNMHCRGSSHGWLIAAGFEEDTGYTVELINPLVSINNECMNIQLPPLTTLPQHPDYDIFGLEYLPKVVLSDNPLTNPKDYVVMAIYGGFCLLAYWKPGDQIWNPVPWSGNNGAASWEILHHKGLYYIVSNQGKVFVCDLGSAAGTSSSSSSIDCDQPPHRPIKVWKIATSPIPKNPGGIEKYLVKLPSSGDLLMVHRFHTIERPGQVFNPHSTIGFSVFKLLVEEEEELSDGDEEVEEEEGEEGPYSSKWRLMSHMENQMFFVGDNASLSLTASEFPGGKPNHIYFTPDNIYDSDGYLDMGVFDYENWNIEQIHPMGSNDYILPITTIWVEPTLRLGDNASMSLPASEFSDDKPNHFTTDCVYDDDGFVDMGVLRYDGWIIEQIHPMGSNDYILPVTTIWVEPTLRCCLRF